MTKKEFEEKFVEEKFIANGSDFAIANAEGGINNINIQVYFPNICSINYDVNVIPTLNSILEHKEIIDTYEQLLEQQTSEEDKFLEVQIKSENEGKEYYYDIANKTWYFVEELSTLKEDRERLNKFQLSYSQAEKRFKKTQRSKFLLILLFAILLLLMQLFDMVNPSDPVAQFAFMGGGLCLVYLCLNFVFSKINFENTGGFRYFDEEKEE